MTTVSNKGLQDQVESLVKGINSLKRLINNPEDSWEKNAIISDAINSLIRSGYIYLQRDYVCEFYDSDATINPNIANRVVAEVEVDKLALYEKIFANSFGPFNPEEYFKIDPKYRIVWLLKEPYILKASWYCNDRGGHNQANEFNTWDKIETPTYENLIKYTQTLLLNLQHEEKKISPESDFARENLTNENIVMNHICILEVNHFPGLALKSTTSNDTFVSEWGKINNPLTMQLIDFYNPQIIFYPKDNDLAKICIPDNLFQVAFEDEGASKDVDEGESTKFLIDNFCKRGTPIKPKIMNRNIERSWFKKDILSKSEDKQYKISSLLDNKGCLWLGFPHPAYKISGSNMDKIVDWWCRILKKITGIRAISNDNADTKSSEI